MTAGYHAHTVVFARRASAAMLAGVYPAVVSACTEGDASQSESAPDLWVPMGVWERVGTLLLGGVKVELELDGERVPAGGFLSGRAHVHGGRRGAEVIGVHVSLVRTAVRPPGSSTTSEIHQKTIVDNTIGSGLRLEPRVARQLLFSFRVPRDAEPSDDDTSYRVRVEAETSQGGAAPTAYKQVRIVDPAAGRPTLDAIVARWPALEGEEEEALLDALRELRYAHDGQDPERDFIAFEPRLAAWVSRGPTTVQSAALEAWSSVVAGRVSDVHVDLLQSLADRKSTGVALLVTLAEAMGRLGSVRALSVLQSLAGHDDVEVRKAIAQAVGSIDRVDDKRTLLEAMRRDANPAVRAAVYRGLADFGDNADVVRAVAAHTTMEPSASVLAACIAVLKNGFAHGHADTIRPAFERLARHHDSEVRIALARALYFVEKDEESLPIARALLDDKDAEVRYSAAIEVRNLSIRGRALCGRLEEMAQKDESVRARRGALTSLPEFTPIDRLVAHFEDLIDTDADPEVLRGIVDGIKFRREPQYRELLEILARHKDADIAAEAEKGLRG